MEINKFNKDLDKEIRRMVPKILGSSAFTKRKVTDTPPDAYSIVSRKYVTLNGVSASRPTSSIVGQFYFDTSINKPVWWNGTSFVDATGTTV